MRPTNPSWFAQATDLPQPPRGDNEPSEVAAQANAGEAGVKPQRGGRSQKWVSKEKALYHSSNAWPSHYYLAAYLWAREQQASDALPAARAAVSMPRCNSPRRASSARALN